MFKLATNSRHLRALVPQISLDLTDEFDLLWLSKIKLTNNKEIRSEVCTPKPDQYIAVLESPVPVNKIIGMIFSKKILNTIRRPESGPEVAEQVNRLQFISQL